MVFNLVMTVRSPSTQRQDAAVPSGAVLVGA